MVLREELVYIVVEVGSAIVLGKGVDVYSHDSWLLCDACQHLLIVIAYLLSLTFVLVFHLPLILLFFFLSSDDIARDGPFEILAELMHGLLPPQPDCHLIDVVFLVAGIVSHLGKIDVK